MPPAPELRKLMRAKSTVSQAHISMRQHAMHFSEADVNDDGQLDLREFCAALPDGVRNKHSEETMHTWFDLLDHDSDGLITRDEWLEFSLNAAALIPAPRTVGICRLEATQPRQRSVPTSVSRYVLAAA